MELGIVLILVAVAIWYGLLKPVETIAKIAVREVDVLDVEMAAKRVKRVNKVAVTEEEVSAAKEKKALLESLDF